jgi:YVTN family beta-propeller protein
MTAKLGAGTTPCGIAFAGGSVWVARLGTNDLVRVDPASGRITKRIPVGGQIWDMEADGDVVWISDQSQGQVVRLDARSGRITARQPAGAMPSGMAVANGQVWIANTAEHTVSRLDPVTAKVVERVPVGHAGPTWFAADGSDLWVTSAGDNTAQRIDAATGKVAASIPVAAVPRDPGLAGGRLWMPSSTGLLTVRNPASGRVESSLHLASGIFVAQPAAGSMWVLNYGGNDVWRLSTGG